MKLDELVFIAKVRESLRDLFYRFDDALPYQHADPYFVNRTREKRLTKSHERINEILSQFHNLVSSITLDELNRARESNNWFVWESSEGTVNTKEELDAITSAFLNLIELLLKDLVASTGTELDFKLVFTSNDIDQLGYSVNEGLVYIPRYLVYHMLVVIGKDLAKMKKTSRPILAERQIIYDFIRQLAEIVNKSREVKLRSAVKELTNVELQDKPILDSDAQFRDSFWKDLIIRAQQLALVDPILANKSYYEAMLIALAGDLKGGLEPEYTTVADASDSIPKEDEFLYISTGRIFDNKDLDRIITVLGKKFQSENMAYVSEVIFGFLSKLVGFNLNESALHIRKFLIAVSSERVSLAGIRSRFDNLETSILKDFPNAEEDPALEKILFSIDEARDILEKIEFWNNTEN